MGAPVKILHDWPASLSVSDALDYTGLSQSQLLKAERDGRIIFKRLGPNGGKVVLRSQLDDLLTFLFSERAGTPLEDMDFG